MPVCPYVRNPGRPASSRYGPIGRFDRMYVPVSSDTAVRFAPVSVCVAVTSAPGSTAPVWSLTVPLICDVETAWASSALSTRLKNPFISPPPWNRIRAWRSSETQRLVPIHLPGMQHAAQDRIHHRTHTYRRDVHRRLSGLRHQ